jgi:hypothetical protein
MEFVRGLRPQERATFTSLYKKIKPEAVDGRIVERAVALLEAKQLREKLCRHCHNALDANPCKICGRLVSSKQNLNDAIVAAAAEQTEDVDVLYCYDTGVFAFAQYMDQKLCMQKPPHSLGPLFEPR